EDGGWRVAFRPPDSFDLGAAAGAHEVEAARCVLFGRCVVQATFEGSVVPVSELPAAVRDGVIAAVAAADPQSDIECRFACPECSLAWTGILDIAIFVWEKIAGRARALVDEIHSLAVAYGWSE